MVCRAGAESKTKPTHPHIPTCAGTHGSEQGREGDLPAARVETQVNLMENENHCGKREGSWLFFFFPSSKKTLGGIFYLPRVFGFVQKRGSEEEVGG